MKKLFMTAMIFIAGFGACLILTHGSLRAQGASGSDIMTKLDYIVQGQEQITATLNEIKEDIKIMKIRITQMQ